MRGYQLIERKPVLWNRIIKSQQLKMLLASISVGMLTGVVVAYVRLNLGLPGHKALFWMVPVLTMRLAGGCKAGTTAGAAGAVLATFSLGGHLAGGPLGWGLIISAGLILDGVIHVLEQKKRPRWSSILVLSTTAMFCNLLCMVKKLFLPEGLGFHVLFNNSGFWFRFGSYAFFGFISGVIAWIIASYSRRQD